MDVRRERNLTERIESLIEIAVLSKVYLGDSSIIDARVMELYEEREVVRGNRSALGLDTAEGEK